MSAPNPDLIRKLGHQFDATPQYSCAEEAIRWLVRQKPRNDELWPVMLKVAAINSLYSTQVFALFELTEHITGLGLDDLLATGSPEAVEAVAHVEFGGKPRRLYSFASKYCSWHRPDSYPIMDSIVQEVIWRHRAELEVKIKRKDLDAYGGFCRALQAFVDRFDLSDISWKELDKGLWMFGKRMESA